MGRLTIRTEKGAALKLDNPQNEAEARKQLHDKYLIAVEKLAHYEDLEELGRLIELPCAVGDEYWCTERDDGGEDPVIHKVHSEPFACLVKDLWGIKCFATKEKAEAKLKELEGDKE